MLTISYTRIDKQLSNICQPTLKPKMVGDKQRCQFGCKRHLIRRNPTRICTCHAFFCGGRPCMPKTGALELVRVSEIHILTAVIRCVDRIIVCRGILQSHAQRFKENCHWNKILSPGAAGRTQRTIPCQAEKEVGGWRPSSLSVSDTLSGPRCCT